MASAADLPPELCFDPVPFLVLTGLDVKYNAVHKSIWDAFSNNRRTDRVPISFGCLPGDHCYPHSKDKRTSYEWYIPKGILKTKWMDKHLHKVPAVVVIFYELDWDEPVWREKQMECVSRVEVVRSSLQGRGTKVAVVLIQKSTPLPPGEDMVAAERAATLCSACDLSAKSLFVLPHTDHLLGYIIRLENAFYELANSYYHTEARRVKSHKEFLNKTTHQLLFPRHQFKIGFFNELMQDPANAVKHYRQAYNHIHELRSHDTNNLEVKVMGGFINYKICRLCFLRLNTPLEAISQFRRHMDLFKPKGGNSELVFEHSAWMSKQFKVFGDLFDEAIKTGLAAIQTQHPGFYYQQAAYYAQERRTQAKVLCSVVSEEEYPTNDPLDMGSQSLDFYGQRPWRQGHQSIDPPDGNKERDGILALKHQEASIDHSWLIIPLLSSAVSQFKKYKCPRMKRFLTVQMGEEYYHAQDYSKAATLLSHTAWDYRSNRWWDILNRILCLTLRCSYLISNVQQYVSASMELLGPNSRLSEQEKTRIQMNLIRVINGKVPDPEPLTMLDNADDGSTTACSDVTECDHVEALEAAKHLWAQVITERKVYNIDMSSLVPFVECKTSFTSEVCTANEAVVLHVYLRTSCPFPIQFSQLTASLGKQLYDEHCKIVYTSQNGGSDTGPELADLYFEPQKFKRISFSFPPDSSDVGKTIRVSSVTLKLGKENEGNCAVLTWNMTDTYGQHDLSSRLVSTMKMALNQEAPKKWDDIVPVSACEIKQRRPMIKVDVMHCPPALINEVYKIQVAVSSQELKTCDNVRAIIRLEAGQTEEIFHSTFLALSPLSVLSCPTTKVLEVNFGTLSPGETTSKNVFLHATKSGARKLSTHATYDIADEVTIPKSGSVHETTCTCAMSLCTTLDAVPAFKLSSKLLTQDFGNLKAVQPGDHFIGLIDIHCHAPCPIELKCGTMNCKSEIVSVADGVVSNILNGIKLEKGESARDVICLHCKEDILHERLDGVEVGEYEVQWRRWSEKDSEPGVDSLPFVPTSVKLPTTSIRNYPLSLKLKLPPYGVIGRQMCLSYTLTNCSEEPRELEVTCEVAENFMFSGVKLQRIRILPGSSTEMTYGLYPLAPGFQLIPSFCVQEIPQPVSDGAAGEYDNEIISCSYLRSHIPNSIFVKPSDK